jgi:hypothetical protein
MPQSILIFDFGANEDAAQQARHKIEGWKQAFRLGDKISLKFEREHSEPPLEGKPEQPAEKSSEGPAAKSPAGQKKSAAPKSGKSAKPGKSAKSAKSAEPEKAAEPEKSAPPARIHLLIRLTFSDHEKLTHHRWLGRIPAEEPFKSAKSEVVRHADPAFAAASDRFDSLV